MTDEMLASCAAGMRRCIVHRARRWRSRSMMDARGRGGLRDGPEPAGVVDRAEGALEVAWATFLMSAEEALYPPAPRRLRGVSDPERDRTARRYGRLHRRRVGLLFSAAGPCSPREKAPRVAPRTREKATKTIRSSVDNTSAGPSPPRFQTSTQQGETMTATMTARCPRCSWGYSRSCSPLRALSGEGPEAIWDAGSPCGLPDCCATPALGCRHASNEILAVAGASTSHPSGSARA